MGSIFYVVESDKKNIVQDIVNYLSCNGPFIKDALRIMNLENSATVTRMERDTYAALVKNDDKIRADIKTLKKLSYLEPRLIGTAKWCSVVHI